MKQWYSWNDAERILDELTRDRSEEDSNVDRLMRYLNVSYWHGRAEARRESRVAWWCYRAVCGVAGFVAGYVLAVLTT